METSLAGARPGGSGFTSCHLATGAEAETQPHKVQGYFQSWGFHLCVPKVLPPTPLQVGQGPALTKADREERAQLGGRRWGARPPWVPDACSTCCNSRPTFSGHAEAPRASACGPLPGSDSPAPASTSSSPLPPSNRDPGGSQEGYPVIRGGLLSDLT